MIKTPFHTKIFGLGKAPRSRHDELRCRHHHRCREFHEFQPWYQHHISSGMGEAPAVNLSRKDGQIKWQTPNVELASKLAPTQASNNT